MQTITSEFGHIEINATVFATLHGTFEARVTLRDCTVYVGGEEFSSSAFRVTPMMPPVPNFAQFDTAPEAEAHALRVARELAAQVRAAIADADTRLRAGRENKRLAAEATERIAAITL